MALPKIYDDIAKALQSGIDAMERESKLYFITGYTTKRLIDLFAAGYTLNPPNNKEVKDE